MTPTEKVLALCDEKGIRISKLERDCGFANGYIKGITSGKIRPERVKILSEYLGVPCYEIDPDTFPVPADSGFYVDKDMQGLMQHIYASPDIKDLVELAIQSDPSDVAMASGLLRRLLAYQKGIDKAAARKKDEKK